MICGFDILFSALGVMVMSPLKLLVWPLGWLGTLAPYFLGCVATFFGRKEITDRFLGCLKMDISTTKAQLGWKTPFSLEGGLSRCFPKL